MKICKHINYLHIFDVINEGKTNFYTLLQRSQELLELKTRGE